MKVEIGERDNGFAPRDGMAPSTGQRSARPPLQPATTKPVPTTATELVVSGLSA